MGRAEGVLALNAPGRSSAARNAGSGSTWRGRLRRPLATSRRERVATESLIGKFNLTAGAPATTVWDGQAAAVKSPPPQQYSGKRGRQVTGQNVIGYSLCRAKDNVNAENNSSRCAAMAANLQ